MPQESLPWVNLRRLHGPEDGRITLKWRNNPAIYKWCRQNDVLHPEMHKRWYENQYVDKTMSMYMIENGSEAPVGVCGLTSIDLINSRAEFSLYIGPEHHKQGYGEAALRELLKKGFLTFGLNSIWGESFDGNPAVTMFERVGFKHEGTRRDFYMREGKFINVHLFSILRSEYESSAN